MVEFLLVAGIYFVCLVFFAAALARSVTVYRSGRVSVALFALVSVLPMALFILSGPKGL